MFYVKKDDTLKTRKSKEKVRNEGAVSMKPIVGKMTVKGQITIPKTIRDWLSVTSSDSIEFNMVRNGVVEMKKHTMVSCPFCDGSGARHDEPCKVCEGEGVIIPLTHTLLSTLFCEFCLKMKQPFTISYDDTMPFPIFNLTTADIQDDLINYREIFQLEAIKLYILNMDDLSKVNADSVSSVLLLEKNQKFIRDTLDYLEF